MNWPTPSTTTQCTHTHIHTHHHHHHHPHTDSGITSETRAWATALNAPLQQTDPDLFAVIEKEKVRQRESLVLIASENFTSKYV